MQFISKILTQVVFYNFDNDSIKQFVCLDKKIKKKLVIYWREISKKNMGVKLVAFVTFTLSVTDFLNFFSS